MTIHPMAPMYWRSVQAGNRTFWEVRQEVRESVRALASQDVAAGRITPEQYQALIGEDYTEVAV